MILPSADITEYKELNTPLSPASPESDQIDTSKVMQDIQPIPFKPELMIDTNQDDSSS